MTVPDRHVYFSDSYCFRVAPSFENLLRLIEDAAHPFLVLLRHYRILGSELNFNSLQSEVMGFIVKEQQHRFSAITG